MLRQAFILCCKETYQTFIETVTKSPADIEACKKTFNNLAGEYISVSSVLNDLTEDTKTAAIAMLEQNGDVDINEYEKKIKTPEKTRKTAPDFISQLSAGKMFMGASTIRENRLHRNKELPLSAAPYLCVNTNL